MLTVGLLVLKSIDDSLMLIPHCMGIYRQSSPLGFNLSSFTLMESLCRAHAETICVQFLVARSRANERRLGWLDRIVNKNRSRVHTHNRTFRRLLSVLCLFLFPSTRQYEAAIQYRELPERRIRLKGFQLLGGYGGIAPALLNSNPISYL